MPGQARSPRRPARAGLAAAALVLPALLLAGCGSEADDEDDAGARAPAASPGPDVSGPAEDSTPEESTPEPPAAADGSDTAACFDGTCQVALSGPTAFGVDPSLGVTDVSVTEIGEDSVSVEATGPGISLGCTTPIGDPCALNELSFQLESVQDGTAVLTFPAPR